MKAKILLRIAAFCILVHLLGHGVGHMTWKTPKDSKMQEVVSQMLNHKAEFMGATRSMGDYYDGYSLILFGVYGMSIVLLWMISTIERAQVSIAQKLLLPIAITYIFFGVIEYLYFFTFAASMSMLAGLLSGFAIVQLGKASS
jgi:hypothetical protein